MTPATFYEKLFSAMEAGNRKGEHTLLEKMSDHFGLRGAADLRAALSSSVEPEKAMVWLLAEAAPFVRMLDEIYHFLADARAALFGRADQLSLLFEKVNRRVSFPLDSFPKTYVRALTDVKVLTTRFTPDARGRLMVDTPNYWRDDVPALASLSDSFVLSSNNFGPLPRDYQRAIRSRVRTALKIIEANYVLLEAPEGGWVWPLTGHVYCADQGMADEIHRLHKQRVAPLGEDQLSRFFAEGTRRGEIVNVESLRNCLRDADQRLGPETPTAPGPIGFPEKERDSNLTYAFVKAYDLCFQPAPMTVRDYADVIDRVFLPFYRERWLLYEIWAILWVRDAIPPSRRPVPRLIPRADDPHGFEWKIPGGDAREPVAAWTGAGQAVELWYQQKTPLTPKQAALFGQNNIEPDVRVRGGPAGDTDDIAILELKDRFNAAGSKEKKIARMYATTGARVVCIANYSRFKARYLRGRVYKETTDDGTEILVAGEFQPGHVPAEISEAFERAFLQVGRRPSEQFDLIGDISASMPEEARSKAVLALAAAGLTPARVFTFDTDLEELTGGATAYWPAGGATDLLTAMRKYLLTPGRAPSGKAVVLTDGDGVAQFRAALGTKEFDGLNLICLDVNEELDMTEVAEWTTL